MTNCFKIEKGVRQGCLLSPCLFNLHTEHMKNAGLGELQAGIKIGRRNNVRYADDTTLMAESEETEKLKNLLKVKEVRKSWLKTQHSEN